MAGLTRNKITYGSLPPWPRVNVPTYYYGVTQAQESGTKYFPGFDNDSLTGSSINMTLNATAADVIKYYNGQGVQITDGVWASGYSPSEAWSDADIWAAHYMDKEDNKLYSLVIDEGTDPDTYRMASVDKDGTVVLETAAFQVTNTAFNGRRVVWNSTPVLRRVGGADGTGNFRFDQFNANTDDNDGSAPFDGAYLEINTSGGTVNSISANTMAESTADGFLPSNIYVATTLNSMIGPTDNNIRGGPQQFYGSTVYQPTPIGWLINMTTGQMVSNVPFGTGVCPIVPATASSSVDVFHWIGNYHFWWVGTQTYHGATEWEREIFHNFMDELAVYYGIL